MGKENPQDFRLLSERDLVKASVSARREERRVHDWQKVLSTQQGRRVLYQILCLCDNDADGFSASPYDTAYNCGLRAVGLMIRKQIKLVKPAALQQMEDEWTALAKQDQKEINDASED